MEGFFIMKFNKLSDKTKSINTNEYAIEDILNKSQIKLNFDEEELDKLLSFKEINLDRVIETYNKVKPKDGLKFYANDLSEVFKHCEGQISKISLYMLYIGYLAGINKK